MVYVTPDGTVVESRPWSFGRLTDLFWGAIDFVLGLTILPGGGRQSNGGNQSGPGGGPGKGGPKRMGNVKTIQDCSMPGGG